MVDAIVATLKSFFLIPEFWIYLTIPVSSAILGWATNVIAIKMMFYPTEFIGIRPPWGWQGIIPAKSYKMASLSVDTMVPRLITVKELFSGIKPEGVMQTAGNKMSHLPEEIISKLMEANFPAIWEVVPLRVKDEMYRRAKRGVPETLTAALEEIKENIEDLLDLKQVMTETLTENKALLNQIFLKVGEKELKFIERSGLILGFLFGLIPMLICFFYWPWWIFPLTGMMVGYITNWIALKMIFKPIVPRKIGPFIVQGLFFKRQKEVSQEYGIMVAEKVLTPAHISEALLHGANSDRVLSIINRHVKLEVDRYTGGIKPFIQLVTGTKGYIDIKNKICAGIVEALPDAIRYVHKHTEKAMGVRVILRDKMEQLSPNEFEGVLHPIFKEDEWILIVIGTILGTVVGIFQLFVLFGGIP